MKLTMDDFTTAKFVPHISKDEVDGEPQPRGATVLENERGTDIGKALLEGDFETDNPFVQAMAEVMATVLKDDGSDITDSKPIVDEPEKEVAKDEKEVNQAEKL